MNRTRIGRLAAGTLLAGATLAGVGAVGATGTAQAAPSEIVVCTYKVTASAANVRTGPSQDRTSLGYVFRGQLFTSRPSQSSNGWIHGSGNGHTGWVKGTLLAVQNCHREVTGV